MNLFGQTFPPIAIGLFALAVFLLAGVYSFVRQGLKFAALVLLALAAMAAFAGVLRV